MKKRVPAILLALCLTLSLLPMAALAAEGRISRLLPEDCPEAPERRDFSQYLTGKLPAKEELTLNGKPFYEYTYSQAKSLLPFKEPSAPRADTPEEGDYENYTTWAHHPTACSSAAHYVGSDGLESLHYQCCDVWETEQFTVIDIGVRGIKTGDSLESVLQALGVSEAGAPLIAAEMMDNHTNFSFGFWGGEVYGNTERSSYEDNHYGDLCLDAPCIAWHDPDGIWLQLNFFLGRLGNVTMGDATQDPNYHPYEEPETPAPAFTDVEEGAYYEGAVKWAVTHEPAITNGATDTTFAPGRNCTEAEILTFLWRAAGEPAEGIKTPVANVKESDYFYQAAMWANDMGMIDPGTFDPAKPCTRSQAVKFIWAAFLTPEAPESGFTDVPAGADYAGAVSWAVANGITNGDGSDTIFSPDKVCTRAQIVTFLHRAYVPEARLTAN